MNPTSNWHHKPLRIIDFIPPEPDRFEELELGEQYRIRTGLGFNAEHIEVHDISTGESGITFYPSDVAVETRKDIMKKIMERYDCAVLKPLVYFNVHWLSPSLGELHPEWLQLDCDGKMLPSGYGAGGNSCINSPFIHYAYGTIRALARYPIAGIFLDGPLFREDGCYCPACLEKFRSCYGYEAPLASTPGSREDIDWFAFKRRSIAEFMRDCAIVLKEIRPEAIIYMNSPQLAPNRLCSRDNRMTVEYQDMLLAEGGFLGGDLRTIPIWKPAATAMLLETQAGGKPYCVAIAGRQSPWSRYLLTPAETWLTHAMAVAHGAWTWYGVYNDNNQDERMSTVREINLFLQEHEEWYTGTVPAAKVGLLWSNSTANYYQTTAEETDFTNAKHTLSDERKNDSRKAFNGWFDVLSRSRIPFSVLDDAALTDDSLKRYEVLVLPGTSCMSAAETDAVREFVKAGGKLIATFDTGFYDEFGYRLDRPALADVLGIASETAVRVCQYDHIQVDANEALFAAVDQSYVPSPKLTIECKAGNGAQSIAFYREPQMSRYCELPPQSEHSFAVRHAYGMGTCLYFAGNPDTLYADFAIPEYRTILGHAVAAFTEPDVVLKTEVESVHLSLRRKGDAYVLHLVNYTGFMTRPIAGIVPQRDLKIIVKVKPGKTGWMASALRSREELEVIGEADGIAFLLPELKEYEVIVITPFG